MIRDSVIDWQELSALYEEADALDPEARASWLGGLRAKSHRLLPQLERMLQASADARENGFLDGPPTVGQHRRARSTAGAGLRIGPYRLLRHVGEGGMSEVWLAERDDGAFHRQVAIKLLRRQTLGIEWSALAQRFERERDILASLDHPNIAALHDAGVTFDHQPWLALEYVEGKPLTAWCDDERLTIEGRVRLFRQVLMAVQHAHANLVIHRDVKPGNILVTPKGEVRLLDFGIAKLLGPEGGAPKDTELTRDGGRPLTLQYCSPEQILGAPLTTASDIYSLGVVLYELLCGERPYDIRVDSAAQVEAAILEVESREPSRRLLSKVSAENRQTTESGLRATLSNDLDAVVLRALAKQPANRYPSVEGFLADLDRWLEGKPVQARTPSAMYRAKKFVSRHRLGVSLAVLATTLLISATSVAIWMAIQARQEATRVAAARDFLLEVLGLADSDRSGGADVSARDLLEAGREKATTELGSQPRLQAELLSGISGVQATTGNYVSADKGFAKVEEIYARLGMTAELASARLDRADNFLIMGANADAQRLIGEVEASPAAYVDDSALHAKLAQVKGWLALSSGDTAAAERGMREAQRYAALAHGETSRQYVNALRGLAEVDTKTGNYERASASISRALAIATAIPGFDGSRLLNIEDTFAKIEFESGKVLAASDRLEAVSRRCDAMLGATKDENCVVRRIWLAAILLREGRDEAALSMVPQLLPKVEDDASPRRQGEALVLVCRVLARNGQLPVGAPLRERLESVGRSGEEVRLPKRIKRNAILVLAEASLLEGDPDKALALAAPIVEESQQSNVVDPRLLSWVHTVRGLALQAKSRDAEALQSFAEANRQNVSRFGPLHPLTILYGLHQARSLVRTGNADAANKMIDAALPVLRTAMGDRSPLVVRVTRLKAQILGPVKSSASQANDSIDFFM
jgi:serine/threonine protein kinase/tetratricopeptide (TPR) repeat protein